MKNKKTGIRLIAVLLAAALTFGSVFTVAAEPDTLSEEADVMPEEQVTYQTGDENDTAVPDETADDSSVPEKTESSGDAKDESGVPDLEIPEEKNSGIARDENIATDPDKAADQNDVIDPDKAEDDNIAADPEKTEDENIAADPEKTEDENTAADPDREDGKNEASEESEEGEKKDGSVLKSDKDDVVSDPDETEESSSDKAQASGEKVEYSFLDDTQKVYVVTLTNPKLEDSEKYQVKVYRPSEGIESAKVFDFTTTDEKTYTAQIKIASLSGSGEFEADVYRVSDTKKKLIDSCIFTVPERMEGTIGISTKKANGSYKVKVSDFYSTTPIKGMRYCAWSAAKGGDDKTWHDMKRSGSTWVCSSTLKDFKNYGTINVRVYIDKEDGTSVLFGKQTFTVDAPKSDGIKITKNRSKGYFTVSMINVTNTFKLQSVKAAVWRKSDMSDVQMIKLSKSGSNYVSEAIYTDTFGGYAGKYHVRVYAYTKNAPTVRLANKTITIKEYSGKLSAADNYAGQAGKMQTVYKLTVRGLTAAEGISKVEFNVWPESDASKAKMYTAKACGNGVYKAMVKIRSFRVEGQYKAEVYVTDTAGNTKKVKTGNVMNVNGVIGGKVEVVGGDPAAGKFDIALTGSTAPSGLNSVQFAVWSKRDRSDKYTYKAKKQSDGSFKATVNIKNHDYNWETFSVSTYGVMGNGIAKYKKDTTVSLVPEKNFVFIVKKEEKKRLIGVDNPSDNLRFAVWSETGGQDDLTWYTPEQSGNRMIVNMDLSDMMHPGVINVHLYSGDTFIRSLTFKAAKDEVGKTGWAYENGLKFYYKGGQKQTDLTGMVNGPYQICVNRLCNTITVYALDGGNGFIVPVISFACSTGLPGMETPTGTYYVYAQNRWEELMGPSWGQYSARVVDGIYIHSVPSSIPQSHYGIDPNEYNKLGSFASHGCIRVNVAAAKWIYDHCDVGTEVYIYDSSSPGPFGKPDSIKLPPGQDWDPTDPAL